MPDLAWIALLTGPAPGAVPVRDAWTGEPAGHLLVVRRQGKPHRGAVRIEPSLLGPGPQLAVSLVLAERGAGPLFDDPAVAHAMRRVMQDPARAPLFSTLVEGSTRWAGSVSGVLPALPRDRPAWWAEDPFAQLAPRLRLLVPPGVFLPVALPAGPCHQRHAGVPWPWGAFAGPVRPS
jgi:hypothetical protein